MLIETEFTEGRRVFFSAEDPWWKDKEEDGLGGWVEMPSVPLPV